VNNKISKKVKPTDDNLDIPNLALYYCIEINNNSSDLSCKKTTGYIKINDNGNQNFYSIGWNGNNDFVTPNNVCSPGLVGQLGTSDKLCLGSFEGELSQTDQSITYIIKPPISGSVFANISDENILIYADTNSFVFENIVDSKSFLFLYCFFQFIIFLFLFQFFRVLVSFYSKQFKIKLKYEIVKKIK